MMAASSAALTAVRIFIPPTRNTMSHNLWRIFTRKPCATTSLVAVLRTTAPRELNLNMASLAPERYWGGDGFYAHIDRMSPNTSWCRFTTGLRHVGRRWRSSALCQYRGGFVNLPITMTKPTSFTPRPMTEISTAGTGNPPVRHYQYRKRRYFSDPRAGMPPTCRTGLLRRRSYRIYRIDNAHRSSTVNATSGESIMPVPSRALI